MDITITLIGQMITFALLVLFTMKFVWPPLTKALEARREKIAAGLAAADQGTQALAKAEAEAKILLSQAREESARILAQARVQGEEMVAQASAESKTEGERQIAAARVRIEAESRTAREELRKEVGRIGLDLASRVLHAEVDSKRHKSLVDELAAKLN